MSSFDRSLTSSVRKGQGHARGWYFAATWPTLRRSTPTLRCEPACPLTLVNSKHPTVNPSASVHRSSLTQVFLPPDSWLSGLDAGWVHGRCQHFPRRDVSRCYGRGCEGACGSQVRAISFSFSRFHCLSSTGVIKKERRIRFFSLFSKTGCTISRQQD
jgi:hypothetical protein